MEDLIALRRQVDMCVRDTLGRAGLTIRDVDMTVDYGDDDVKLRRRTIGLEVETGSATFGDSHPITCSVKPFMTHDRMVRRVTAYVDLMLALLAREKTIAPFLDEGSPPDWSVVVEPTARHLLEQTTWSRKRILQLYTTADGNRTAGRQGLTTGFGLNRTNVQTAPGQAYPASNAGMGLSRGVLTLERFEVGEDARKVRYEGGHQPSVTVTRTELPDTIVNAIAGRGLNEIIDHPAFAHCTEKVGSARLENGGSGRDLVLNLRRRRVPFAPAPAGVDVAWLGTISKI